MHEPQRGVDIFWSANTSDFLSIKLFITLQLVEKTIRWKQLSNYALSNDHVNRHKSYFKFNLVLGVYLNLIPGPVNMIYSSNIRDSISFGNCSLSIDWIKYKYNIGSSNSNRGEKWTTISDKNCETHTPSPLIQCWLQVCLLICGLGCLAMLLQAWHNIESGGRGDSG